MENSQVSGNTHDCQKCLLANHRGQTGSSVLNTSNSSSTIIITTSAKEVWPHVLYWLCKCVPQSFNMLHSMQLNSPPATAQTVEHQITAPQLWQQRTASHDAGQCCNCWTIIPKQPQPLSCACVGVSVLSLFRPFLTKCIQCCHNQSDQFCCIHSRVCQKLTVFNLYLQLKS